MNNVMIDIETLGTESYSAILSIAAVRFNMDGETSKEIFHETINLESSLNFGLRINANTLKWWVDKDIETFKKNLSGIKSLNIVLHDLTLWINSDDIVWGNSARFDLGLLHNAFEKCMIPIPWSYRNERCVRTVADFNEKLTKEVKQSWKGEPHNPVDDCLLQIEYVTKILALIK